MGRHWFLACMLLSMAMAVRAYSSGAPAAACARIYPEGHSGTSLSLSSSPFVLDISQLYNQLGNIYYTPGYSYTRKACTALATSHIWSSSHEYWQLLPIQICALVLIFVFRWRVLEFFTRPIGIVVPSLQP